MSEFEKGRINSGLVSVGEGSCTAFPGSIDERSRKAGLIAVQVTGAAAQPVKLSGAATTD